MATGQSKKRDKKSYHKKTTSPKMPKDSEEKAKGGPSGFRPGQGGKWSAKVGQRDVRRITEGGREKIRTRSDNYNSGSEAGSPKISKQRAADTKGITKIGKY
jgi:hypothetical protein